MGFTLLNRKQVWSCLLTRVRQLHSKRFEEMPKAPALPLVGSLHLYKSGSSDPTQYHNVMKDLYKKYGLIFQQTIKGIKTVQTCNPEDAKMILKHDSRTPDVPPLQDTLRIYREYRKMSPGLGNTNGKKWYDLRKAANEMLMRPKQVASYVGIADEVALEIVEQIKRRKNEDAEIADLQSLLGKWALEGAGLMVLGKKLGTMDGGDNEKLAQDFASSNFAKNVLQTDLLFSWLDAYRLIPTFKWRQFVRAEDTIASIVRKWLSQTMDEISQLESEVAAKKFYYLSHLMSQTDLNDDDVVILVITPFDDAINTTTPSLLYVLYALAKHQDTQQKLYEEVMRLLPQGTPINQNTLASMNYMKAVNKETFRMYPLIPETSRYVNKDVILSGYHVPKGTHVNMNMFINFLDEKYFPDPHTFKPERWLNREFQSLHPYVLLPFSHGPRMCIGKRVAEQHMFLTVARILQNFKLSYPEGELIDQTYAALLRPDRPIRVRFHPR